MISRRGWLVGIGSALAARAAAEVRPVLLAGPLRIIVAYPPGGVSDSVARGLARQLALQLDVQVVVDNRPGAAGARALELLARAAPDGRSLAFAAVSALDRLAVTQRALAAAIVPVAGVMHTPVLVVGTPALQADSLAGLLAIARTQAVRWATTGEGTTGHRVLEEIRRASGAAITHVPYKGGGQQINDALGGQFEVLSTNVAALQLEAIRSGRLKPLAVGATARLPVLPEVPTLAELGYPQANLGSLFGLFAPPDTPPRLVERLNHEVDVALRDETLRASLLAVDNVPAQGSAQSFRTEIERARAR